MPLQIAQAAAAAFGYPQLANVFYYGKEFGSKKQKLSEKGTVEEELYKPLSVVQPGVEPEQVVEQIEPERKKAQNPVDLVLNSIDDNMSFDELLQILRG